jgi:hypothetical protein
MLTDTEIDQVVRRMTISSILAQYSRNVEEVGDNEFRFSVSVNDRRYRAQLLHHEEENLLRLYVFTDSLFLSSLASRVSELASRISSRLVFGSLEWDWESRAVHFRNAMRFTESQEVEQLECLLSSSVLPLQLWNQAFPLLHDHHLEPVDCSLLAFYRCGMSEVKGASSAAMRHVIQLVK